MKRRRISCSRASLCAASSPFSPSGPFDGRKARPTRRGRRSCGCTSRGGGAAPSGYRKSTRLGEVCVGRWQAEKQGPAAQPVNPTLIDKPKNVLKRKKTLHCCGRRTLE